MKSSSGGHVVGVPVTSKAYGIEEKVPAKDHLAVSLTHPSPYTSFGYKHSKFQSCMHATTR
jgi:uracil DNA glycosylase